MSSRPYNLADALGEDGGIESWILSPLLSLSPFFWSTRAPLFEQRTMAPDFTPLTPSASKNRRYFWREDGEIDCASLGRNTTARFPTSNILFSRMLLVCIRQQPVMFQNVLLVAILVSHACLIESRQAGQLPTLHTMPRDDIMANDGLLFHASSHFQTAQHEDNTTHNVSLNRTVPIFGTLDDPSANRSRPRHHFRKGAVSEASGQSSCTYCW